RAANLTELSVSIAHEINQPLGAIVANAHAFQRWLSATPPNFERAGRTADRIISNANAAAHVVGRIRALFSQTAQPRGPVDINMLTTEACGIIAERMASNGIQLETDLDVRLPTAVADRMQIEQVVLNLVRNGIEAMQDVDPGRRTLSIVSRQRGD